MANFVETIITGEHASFPAHTKQAAREIKGLVTDVMSISFADKIIVIISQGGKLSQWIQVPLESSNPFFFEQHLPSDSEDDKLLPMAHLTPKTLLGGSDSKRQVMGYLCASQIASTISTKNPGETRTVIVGLGLLNVDHEREDFFSIIELVQSCL
ncbi:MAG: hypothetical protein M1829_005998 [Trizodia sp. TS-e1964]|nr:MAG: hypothetical protein M1829_005998 [Trizodia sp. TS-e1964]